MIKAIFFDAVGTLFHLTKSVGDHYALVGNDVGLKLDPAALERAFFAARAAQERQTGLIGRVLRLGVRGNH